MLELVGGSPRLLLVAIAGHDEVRAAHFDPGFGFVRWRSGRVGLDSGTGHSKAGGDKRQQRGREGNC